MRKILVMEIDVTEAGDNWAIVIQKNDLFLGPTSDAQVVVKRSSRDLPYAMPSLDDDNSLLKNLYIETHEP